jgi:hypothetical protein
MAFRLDDVINIITPYSQSKPRLQTVTTILTTFAYRNEAHLNGRGFLGVNFNNSLYCYFAGSPGR